MNSFKIGDKVFCRLPRDEEDNSGVRYSSIMGIVLYLRDDMERGCLVGILSPMNFIGHSNHCQFTYNNWHDKCWWVHTSSLYPVQQSLFIEDGD